MCDADVVVLSHEYAGDCDWCSSDVSYLQVLLFNLKVQVLQFDA